MLYIKKQAEPQQLIDDKRNGLKSYLEITSTTKNAIKEALLNEQGYLCAYCMQRISIENATIEHYIAQNPKDIQADESLSIAYNNMLAVCGGNVGLDRRKNELICDKHRGNISLTVNPLDEYSIEKISYKADGTIYSHEADIQNDLDKTLNLNCEAVLLKQNRKSVLDAVKRDIFRKSNNIISKRQIENMLTKMQQKKEGKYIPFVGIAIWYLKKKLVRD